MSKPWCVGDDAWFDSGVMGWELYKVIGVKPGEVQLLDDNDPDVPPFKFWVSESRAHRELPSRDEQ